MKFTKAPYILLFFFILNSCTKSNKATITKSVSTKDLLPKMIANNESLELPNGYINSKKNEIAIFYNKNWANYSQNGSILVAKNGQIIFEKYEGFADFESKKLNSSNTPLHIASVTKVFTATAILLLINAKKIDLNQKIVTILPTFPYQDITIKMLLDHRSGLRNYAYFTAKDNLWDKHQILSNQDVLALLGNKNIELEFTPSTRFSYCNTNYAILALVIEKITNLTYKEAITQMIFDPLGMKSSYVFEYKKDKQTATPSYRGYFNKVSLDYLDAVYGDKNIYSTPRDLLKFDRARSAKTFLNANLVNQIFTGYSNEHKGIKNYGLGMRMINWETGQHFYFHNGWWHGNNSSYITLRKEGVTIIALSNKFNRATYKVKYLSKLFGDYPFKSSEDDDEQPLDNVNKTAGNKL